MKVTFEDITESFDDIIHSYFIELDNGEHYRLTQEFLGASIEDRGIDLANGCVIELTEVTPHTALDFSALLSAFEGRFENCELYEATSYNSCIQVHKTVAFDDYSYFDNTIKQTAAIMRYLRDYEQKVA